MPAWAVTFDVAFDVDPADEPDVADWVDLSTRLHGTIETTSGTGRLSGSAAGFATVLLDNADRAIDPTNGAAVYNLVPLRHARLRVTIGATTYPLFRGFVDAWPPSWSAFDSVVKVRMVDGFAWLALQDADLDLPKQMSHERIEALLDLAGWPAGLRDIGDGVIELEAHEQSSGNLLRSLQDAADAEDGDLYVAPDGKITFRSRHARFSLTPAMILGDGGIPFSSATPAWDTAWLTNTARVELEDGDVYEVIDDASVTEFGTRVMPTRDLALRAAEAEAMAQWEVYRFATQRLWLDGVLVEDAETGALVAALARRVGHLVTVAHTAPAGDPFTDSFGVEKIHHRIGDVDWTIDFDLAPHFGEGPWLILDDAILGLLDEDNVLAP